MQLLADVQHSFLRFDVAQTGVERVAVSEALGRICGTEVASPIDVPNDDNSAMDGFAILAGDQTSFEISQRVQAGDAPEPLKAGTAARIFTGAVLPPNSDTVVIQENCSFDQDQVRIKQMPDKGANVRSRAQDLSAGDTVVPAGRRVTAIDLSLLNSVGFSEVDVRKRLRVAVLATGDELVAPGQPLSVGKIYNSNQVMLTSLCEQAGCEVVWQARVDDTAQATQEALQKASQQADLILSSGGVSVGEEDHVKSAVEALGALSFWKIKMKPGKPVAFGTIDQSRFLGLPGNPVSSFVVFQLLAMPLIRALQGADRVLPRAFRVRSAFAKKAGSREEYLRVKFAPHSVDPRVELFANLSSGILSSLGWADGLVRQPADVDIAEDDWVDYLPLHNGSLW